MQTPRNELHHMLIIINYIEQLNNQLDLHLKMIGVIEPKYRRLVTEVPPYNYINSEMI